MLKKIKNSFIIMMASFAMMVPALALPIAGGIAHASIKSQLCSGANVADTSSDCSGGDGLNGETTQSKIKTLAKTIVNVISLVVGVAAVIFIIIAGFRYITSGGDSNKVGSAKNTLIYAIIGLIVVALAQIIVQFVVNTAVQSTDGIG